MPVVTLVTRNAQSLDLTVADSGGETAWQVEWSRSADFFMDESWTKAIAVAGGFSIVDLCSDTTYFIRARKTNGGNGPWTTPLILATLQPTLSQIPYTGFSIEPAILVVPECLSELAATNLEAGSLAENLNNDDPMSTMRIAGASTAITFRQPGRPIDVFSILGTQANDAVTWRIRGAATAAGVTSAPSVDTGVVPFRVNQGIKRRAHYHAYRRLASPVSWDYWRIDIAGVTANFMARNLVVGLARQSVNISRGAGYSPTDQGRVERTLLGSPDRVRGWRGKQVDFPLSWIREAEYEAKWSDLEQLVGTTDPVLALPNPKLSAYFNDRIAYGTAEDMRGEIMRGDRWQRTLRINSLY